MNTRTHHLIWAWTCIAIVLAFPILILLDEIPDADMYIIGGIASVITALVAMYHFMAARRAPVDERGEAAPQPDAQVAMQLAYLRRALLLSLIMIPFSAALTMWFLDPSMENARNRTLYWAPLQYIHEQHSYWPTVLALPLFFTLASLLFLWKIRKVRGIVEITYR